MRKGILAIAAAGSIFALTAAGAAGTMTLNNEATTKVTVSGGTTFTQQQCTTVWNVSYTRVDDQSDITAVTATASTADAQAGICGTQANATWFFTGASSGEGYNVAGAFHQAVGQTPATWTFDFTGPKTGELAPFTVGAPVHVALDADQFTVASTMTISPKA